MNNRYRVGFESDTAKSPLTERNPGYYPLIDTQGISAFGDVSALFDTKEMADYVCALLNATYTYKDAGFL